MTDHHADESQSIPVGPMGSQVPASPQPPVTSAPPPGWYPVPGTRPVQRWWDGAAWSGPEYPLHTPTPPQSQPPALIVNPDRGPRISETPKRTSHTFHLVMSIITLGLWLPVWGIVWLVNKSSTEQVRHY